MKEMISSLAILAALASGCSSSLKQTNPRMGLFDEMSELEPAHKSTDLTARHVRESEERLAATRAPVRSSDISSRRVPAAEVVPASAKQVAIRWPLKQVQVTSPYGKRGREFHEGVDLRAKVGTPVYAAHSGQVLYSGDRIRGYGRMIVIRHTTGLATIYAHASRLVVRKGQWVSQGTLIAYTGNTGHSHGPICTSRCARACRRSTQ